MNTNGLALCLAGRQQQQSAAAVCYHVCVHRPAIIRTPNGVVTSTIRLVRLRTSVKFAMKGGKCDRCCFDSRRRAQKITTNFLDFLSNYQGSVTQHGPYLNQRRSK